MKKPEGGRGKGARAAQERESWLPEIFNLLHQWPFGVWSRRGHAEILSSPSMAFPPRALLCTTMSYIY